jgi:hypothetical protein
MECLVELLGLILDRLSGPSLIVLAFSTLGCIMILARSRERDEGRGKKSGPGGWPGPAQITVVCAWFSVSIHIFSRN